MDPRSEINWCGFFHMNRYMSSEKRESQFCLVSFKIYVILHYTTTYNIFVTFFVRTITDDNACIIFYHFKKVRIVHFKCFFFPVFKDCDAMQCIWVCLLMCSNNSKTSSDAHIESYNYLIFEYTLRSNKPLRCKTFECSLGLQKTFDKQTIQ